MIYRSIVIQSFSREHLAASFFFFFFFFSNLSSEEPVNGEIFCEYLLWSTIDLYVMYGCTGSKEAAAPPKTVIIDDI